MDRRDSCCEQASQYLKCKGEIRFPNVHLLQPDPARVTKHLEDMEDDEDDEDYPDAYGYFDESEWSDSDD